MTLAACTGNDELTGDEDSARLSVLHITTRAATDGTPQSFTEGSTVKVFADNESTLFTLASGGSWQTSDGKNYLTATLPATLTAVYPATAEAANKFTMATYNASENVIQDTADQLAAADYMTSDAQTITTPPTAAVDFTLKHRLCKVTITIDGYGTEFGGTLPTISHVAFFSTGRGIEYSAGAWNVTGQACMVYPYITQDKVQGHHKYEAIITPGSYAAVGTMMALTVNDKFLHVSYTGTLESGSHYTYTLKVGKDNVTLTQVGALPGWGTEGDETEL